MPLSPAPVEVFYVYVEQDASFLEPLERHLSMLQRSGTIVTWYARKVTAGSDWMHDINVRLNRAPLILLLISSHFLASDYAYGVELQRAMQRHRGLNNLALLYLDQGKYEEAEPLLKRALAILEKVLGQSHPTTQTARANYAVLLQVKGRKE